MYLKKFGLVVMSVLASLTTISASTQKTIALTQETVSMSQLTPITNLIKYTSNYDSLDSLSEQLDLLGRFLKTKLYNNTMEGAVAFGNGYGIHIDGNNFTFSFSNFKRFYKELFGFEPSLKIGDKLSGSKLILAENGIDSEAETTLEVTPSKVILHTKAAYANLIYTIEYKAEITNYLGNNLYRIKLYQYSTIPEEPELINTYDVLVKQGISSYIPLLLKETDIDDSNFKDYIKPPSATNEEIIENILQLVNEERVKVGLNPLQLDYELTKVAQIKSTDMQDNHYFSHVSPTYGSPIAMVEAFDITGWNKIGANIAMGHQSPKSVMNSWMNSPDHKSNILKPEYTHIGIGHTEEANYWTQIFLSKYI